MIIANFIVIGLQITKVTDEGRFHPLSWPYQNPKRFRVKKLSKLNNKVLHLLLKKLFFSFQLKRLDTSLLSVASMQYLNSSRVGALQYNLIC